MVPHSFSYHDFKRLAINDDLHLHFPPSPLKEPFHSLFAISPNHAIRLLAELSNHAMTAWRQLQQLSRDGHGTPIPLGMEFPWGRQEFWGSDREYLWSRGMWAPNPIACGYFALEDWAFDELKKGCQADQLIRRLVTGNRCIAVLGVASAIAIQSVSLTEAVFPLVTSQLLLTADRNRLLYDLTESSASLMGFSGKGDHAHVEAIRRINSRPVRKYELRWLLSCYFINHEYRERTKAAVLDFVNCLPFGFEDERDNAEFQEGLRQEALKYAELVVRREPAIEGQISGEHVSPSNSTPERIAEAGEAERRLREGHLWIWGAKYFETGLIQDGFTLISAVEFAKTIDDDLLFTEKCSEEEMIGVRRGAVAAAAAVVLSCRDDIKEEDLEWARDVLKRAICAPEAGGPFWIPQAEIPWHQCIFAARGFSADLRHGTAEASAANNLLSLVAHPLEVVSLAALSASFSLWEDDPRLGWNALYLALTLCIFEPSGREHSPYGYLHTEERVCSAFTETIRVYLEEEYWSDLPVPPPAWIKAEDNAKIQDDLELEEEFEDLAISGPAAGWVPSPVGWYHQYAIKILKHIPLEKILQSSAAPKLLNFLDGILQWTISKLEPPFKRDRRIGLNQSDYSGWPTALGGVLGMVSAYCSLAEVESRFLNPIFKLEDDNCWKLLAPFVDLYLCVTVYDSREVQVEALEVLKWCLDRFLADDAFRPGYYRSGELSGFDEPRLAKALMFVVGDEPATGAARFANGNWTEIGLILPLVDSFVRRAGWSATIMSYFIRLCERASEHYPAEQFADQILYVLVDCGGSLKGWRGTSIPSRIAGLVQTFADRETPLPLPLGQKFLRVLDLLIDMGDRRSAALQTSEYFREIQIS